ncbi:MAG: hypothetical protein K5681_02560 [Treponema sp.]|nr:hypothetical protein [Treponema sp.]
MRKLVSLSFIILSLFVLLSCATTVTVNVTRPAKLDLNGAKTISVLPFTPSDYYSASDSSTNIVIVIADFFRMFDRSRPDERRCLNYLHDEIESGLMTSPYVDVISSSAVQAAIKNGSPIPADVYLTGQVVYFDIDDEKEIVKKKVEEEEEDDDDIVSLSSSKSTKYIIEEYYVRHVKMEIKYQVVDSKTNRIVASDKASIRDYSSRYERKSQLPEAYDLLDYELRSLANKILRDIQPYVVRKSIKLMKDKSKMPAIKAADDLAKKGFLKESYESFIKIYRDTNMLVAGYNAAMLLEAQGKLTEAESLMKEVYVLYPESAVLDGLYDIQSEIKQSQRLQNQIQ